ncbi:hypothetical protein EV715DRAFT_268390 [Schizophyllum commune]
MPSPKGRMRQHFRGHEKVNAALKQDWFKQASAAATALAVPTHPNLPGKMPKSVKAEGGGSKGKGAKRRIAENDSSNDKESEAGGSSKRRKVKQMEWLTKVLMQGTLKAYKRNDMPFPKESIGPLEQQVERTTLSANLPWRWIEDIEVQILTWMMRIEAPAVLPTAFILSDQMLDKMEKEVESKIVLRGEAQTQTTDHKMMGQLVTHNYFKEDANAALTTEQVTELIGWIRNHQRVKAIFDNTQLEVDPDAPILPLPRAAFNYQCLIIKAQVGAEKN